MAKSRRSRIEACLERFASLRVLVVGDLLLDEDRLGEADRISPEAPVPVVRVHDERVALGGAGNVARGLVALGASCRLVAIRGEDAEGARAAEGRGFAKRRAWEACEGPLGGSRDGPISRWMGRYL